MLEWIVSASVLMVVVMISRHLLKGRVRCWVQYSLWLLVALRLLIPVSPVESVFSVANLLPESRAGQDGEAVFRQSGTGTLPDENPASFQGEGPVVTPVGMHVPAEETIEGGTVMPGRYPAETAVDNPAADSIAGGKNNTILRYMMIIWIAGGGFLLLWLMTVNGVFRWRIRKNRKLCEIPEGLQTRGKEDEALQGLQTRGKRCEALQGLQAKGKEDEALQGLQTRGKRCEALQGLQTRGKRCEALQGLRMKGRKPHAGRETARSGRLLPVYVTDQVHTPCMYGLLHPAIYVTPRVAEEPEVLAMVLRHEQMHYRHGDHFWAVVRALCLCMHWYHPLVWAAAHLSRQDGELACDEGVVRQLGEGSRRSYGETLLALSMEQRITPGMSLNLATSMSDTGKQLKERLSALVRAPQMAVGTVLLVMTLSLGLVACTFTGRQQDGDEGIVGESMEIDGEPGTETDNGSHVQAKDDGGNRESGADDERAENAEAIFSEEAGDPVPSEDPQEPQEPPYGAPWFFAEEYTGYLDECTAVTWGDITWQEIYEGQDYDGDGLTDRIYQDVESEPGVMKMRMEFGNGEILAFDTYMNSPITVQSMDLDMDGSRELLFTKPNGFSTNPMGIATDILLFTRQEGSYRQVEIPSEEVDREYRMTPLDANLILSYAKADDTHIRVSWRVPGAKGDLGKTQEILRPVDEETMEYYQIYFGHRYPTPAYEAELIQERYAFLRLYFQGLDRSGDSVQVDMVLENGRLSPVSSSYVYWDSEEMEDKALEQQEPVFDSWDAQIAESFDENGNLVAEVTEGELTRKLTYVETEWSLSAANVQFSNEILYWACQALNELEQWTGSRLTESCYSVTEFGDYAFAQTPEDMQHSRCYYSRCYGSLAGGGDVIQSISYSTDMDVWYSPVKQYTMPPGYDKMTMEELLTWFFERSVIAQGSKAAELVMPWEGDYILRTDQDTYYEFTVDGAVQKGLSLAGPYDSYPQH